MLLAAASFDSRLQRSARTLWTRAKDERCGLDLIFHFLLFSDVESEIEIETETFNFFYILKINHSKLITPFYTLVSHWAFVKTFKMRSLLSTRNPTPFQIGGASTLSKFVPDKDNSAQRNIASSSKGADRFNSRRGDISKAYSECMAVFNLPFSADEDAIRQHFDDVEKIAIPKQG